MNAPAPIRVGRSVCPHDCPSTCALDVDIVDSHTIGRVRGAKDDPYTAGVICEKVARYAERIHHPDRLLYPMRRTGPKGSGQWERIGWDEALDEIATRLLKIEAEFGTEAIWPYYYAGTMGHVQRDGIDRLRNARGYSLQYDTICTGTAWPGYIAGAGLLGGVSPEQIIDSGVVVIWGTNAVVTQVNLMTHAVRARKERGAKIVVIDIYRNATMEQADMPLVIRPGSDAALACAAMHILLRDGLADRDFMATYTDFDDAFAEHLQSRTPEWASKITGLTVEEIEAFAKLVGTTPNTYFRLGYGFTRQRNGALSMHAALSIPAMTGAWRHRGGGAFHTNGGTWALDKSLLRGDAMAKDGVRELDMCEIGPALTGDPRALRNGGPVKALFIQNTNPANVAPDQTLVREGFLREDLFVVVHEQFMTDTARLADIVLPATMFLEHNDYYTRSGHTRVLFGPKLVEAPGEAKPNFWVINELLTRLGTTEDPAMQMSDREVVAATLKSSGYGELDEIEANGGFIERARPDGQQRFADGFAWPDGRYRFRPNWQGTADKKGYTWVCDPAEMPEFADYWHVNEPLTDDVPFRMSTSPARSFLNSSFSETPGSRKRVGEPALLIHPEDAADLGIANGGPLIVGNRRGQVPLKATYFDGIQRGVVIAEGIHPNSAHAGGRGINTLIGSDPVRPFGGAAFHDCAVWVRPA
jgi:anaerobic selenocysteine-containing dehydrogenase